MNIRFLTVAQKEGSALADARATAPAAATQVNNLRYKQRPP